MLGYYSDGYYEVIADDDRPGARVFAVTSAAEDASALVHRFNLHVELVAALESYVGCTPWERVPAGDGLCQTDEPWYCRQCGAEIPYTDPDCPGSEDGAHIRGCAWLRARAALQKARTDV